MIDNWLLSEARHAKHAKLARSFSAVGQFLKAPASLGIAQEKGKFLDRNSEQKTQALNLYTFEQLHASTRASICWNASSKIG